MSAPVDVLAEMELASERLFDAGLHGDLSLDVARAAVAELIEKVDELLSSHGEYRCYGGAGESIESNMRAELVSALARVKGGAV